ncbi:MAG: molybdopterin-binding oxidoreductase, partial [Thermomicrobiales bacterium]
DHGVISAGPTEIGGVAFAGDRGIRAVEVSVDDGKTGKEASIVENPSPGGLSWVLWKLAWIPASGAYQLVVRATDGMGEVQTKESASELPDGASGWHRITVGVA